MESLAATIFNLQKVGISVFESGDGIRFKASSGACTEDIAEYLLKRRRELSVYLRAKDAARYSRLECTQQPLIPSLTQEMWWSWIDKSVSPTLSAVENFENIDAVFVESAIRSLIANHEVLRSFFLDKGGALAVGIHSEKSIEIERELVPTRVTSQPDSWVIASLNEFLSRPMYKTDSHLLRVKVISIPSYGAIVALVISHLIVDGSSIEIIKSELRRRVLGFGLTDGTIKHTARYADFARWQRSYVATSGDALIEYWRDWMKEKPELISPMGKKILRRQSGAKILRKFVVPGFAHKRALALARSLSTFPFVLYLTVLAIAVAKWSGQCCFPIRSVSDARVFPELRSTVGLMTSADAINIDVKLNHSFVQNLRAIESEYYCSTRLRLPTICAYPPFVAGPPAPSVDQADNIGVIINYRNVSVPQNSGVSKEQEKANWPPAEGAPELKVQQHHMSPIYVELTNWGNSLGVCFRLHNDLLTAEEQNDFVASFFQTLADTVIDGRGLPHNISSG